MELSKLNSLVELFFKKYKEKKLQFHKNKITWDNLIGNYIQGDWDTPHMEFQAEITCRNGGHILECGFGMGISATHIQKQNIKSHTIIELNDEIYEKAVEGAKDKPKTKANIRKSIKTFEDIWVYSIREKKKNERRKV